MSDNCTADADHPCGKTNGQPCDDCTTTQAYWRKQRERSERYEPRYSYPVEDVIDCYSDPTERAKRDSLLGAL